MAAALSASQCTVLAAQYASEANVPALHTLTAARADALPTELALRILLTYLPETTDPQAYTSYVEEVASHLYLNHARKDVELDIGPVKELSEKEADKKAKKIKSQLATLTPPSFPPDAPTDPFTLFVCHRTYRIDAETGLISLIPALARPFLDRSNWLRTWYISVCLPILRLQGEYYSDRELSMPVSLRQFEGMKGSEVIELLLQFAKSGQTPAAGVESPSKHSCSTIGRDVRGLVGPWMYGHTYKRKKKHLVFEESNHGQDEPEKIPLKGVDIDSKTGHQWELMFLWLVDTARTNLPLSAQCIEDWNGPNDIDLANLAPDSEHYLDEDVLEKLKLQYAQAAFASCYITSEKTLESVSCAHAILARLSELLDFIPPPDLATSVDSLPKIQRHAVQLEKSQTTADLAQDSLLRPEHPLTTPRYETYMLLQMMVYSAYLLTGLGHATSVRDVALLHFYGEPAEQMEVLKKILRELANAGPKSNANDWQANRARLLWLWNWGIETDDEFTTGFGVLGKIGRGQLEEELLKVFLDYNYYALAVRLYLDDHNVLSRERVENVVSNKVMEAYDSASNGNRTRGGMKKASDIIAAFRPFFPQSTRFEQALALIAGTHSLSFYSLKLQHNVPFQPVSIRVSSDPVGLIEKVLDQNPASYTRLDDMISIADNFVLAGLTGPEGASMDEKQTEATRRVTFMAVEAALKEDDFETAYSYVVNRLNTSKDSNDDISWRAAFLAGSYRSSTAPNLRRLEQRGDLISLALLLAPAPALNEILAAWRRCEEETTNMQAQQREAEMAFDSRPTHVGTGTLPGQFASEQPEMVLNQPRREMGRVGTVTDTDADVPVSMFELTRSAAQALKRNAFPLRAEADGEHHVRRRDMVANAVSGGLASGLGWMLGATPREQS
ncbi:secretory pathway Sec39 [Piedraia hortae CBS 480.64]|uniref:Secretory pathway Sec39 n=1 Tax=Piedraia hortae CBS 480.64 TaxID=1314780 RepID=A0A6A7C1Z1_9PEZI|nr:secretory pathway Sec39 [Piedraia hortae CBS 480.64]